MKKIIGLIAGIAALTGMNAQVANAPNRTKDVAVVQPQLKAQTVAFKISLAVLAAVKKSVIKTSFAINANTVNGCGKHRK